MNDPIDCGRWLWMVGLGAAIALLAAYIATR